MHVTRKYNAKPQRICIFFFIVVVIINTTNVPITIFCTPLITVVCTDDNQPTDSDEPIYPTDSTEVIIIHHTAQ